MRQLLYSLVLGATLIVAALAWAADLTGTVINGTTKKPANGDEVILLTLSEEGMVEAARTRADGSGHFTLPLADPENRHVVRVVHQGVNYHHAIDPGIRSLTVAVYNVADRVDGITAVMDVERFEATNETPCAGVIPT